jgi:DNA-binding response OmpR family regulator
MEKKIIVLDADPAQSRDLCTLLEGQAYNLTVVGGLAGIDKHIPENDCFAIILNLDTVAVDNRILRKLKQKTHRASIIALSGRTHHPELEESLRENISACLTKPTDLDELVYWLNAVFKNAA